LRSKLSVYIQFIKIANKRKNRMIFLRSHLIRNISKWAATFTQCWQRIVTITTMRVK